MKMLQVLKTLFWFQRPDDGHDQHAHYIHASRWQRWREAAVRDNSKDTSTTTLPKRIFSTLRWDIMWAVVAIAVHSVAAFGAALTLKSLLTQFIQEDAVLVPTMMTGAICVVLTYFAWLALNHTFFLAELVGIGGRSYVEQRILLRNKSDGDPSHPFNIAVLIDREATRVETFWTSLVTIWLALSTVIFTSVFFFIALGVSALAALAVIGISAVAVFFIAQRLNNAYEKLSASSAQRIEIGTFATKNKQQIWLKNWNKKLIEEYANRRGFEAASLKKAAHLVAAISLISTMSPMVALLSTALLQFFFLGRVDTPGILSAIALLGGLRSVANNMPDIVQSMSKGVVGHKNIALYLANRSNVSTASSMNIPATANKHIAITGKTGSGKTSLLKDCMRRFSDVENLAVYIPDEPWIFTGGLYDNLALYGSDFSHDEVYGVLILSRLPENFYLDYLNHNQCDAASNWNISRGQGKRLELARALLAKPKWIFIDQPTSGLDAGLADGLLVSLLQGPWRDTNVIFVTDRLQEQAAAQEIWTVSDGTIAEVNVNQNAACFLNKVDDVFKAPSVIKNKPEILQDVLPNYQGGGKKTILKSLLDFGLWNIAIFTFVILVIKEGLSIYGDYIIASGRLSEDLIFYFLLLAFIIFIGCFFSITGALLAVKKSIDSASFQCVRYFRSLMNPSLCGPAEESVNREFQNKLTWDQRRADEILPVLILETIGAAALLAITASYVFINNIYIVFPVFFIGIIYWYGMKNANEKLKYFNTVEIGSTSALLSKIEAIDWSGGRFNLNKDNSNVFNWLSSVLAKRAYASLDNSAIRRWFSFRLDLMGVLFLSSIIVSVIYLHSNGNINMTNILAISLSYNLIAIFGRMGRCLVELRQVLDSADRLVVADSYIIDQALQTTTKDNTALVSFSHVTFINKINGKTLLKEFHQNFNRADVVVIMGPSGIGKSTFANLITGTLRPNKGCILTIGHESRYVERTHDEDVQLLTSNPIFKPGRLREHFHSCSEHEFTHKAAYLGFSELLKKLSKGFDEPVDWNGEINLSKSEKQKLAVLDVIINKPAIVILDEATSELKPDDELVLVKKLVSALPDTLFFIITHNLQISGLGNKEFHFTDEGELLEKNII